MNDAPAPMSAMKLELPDREVVLSRIFEANRALVWKAWTEPKHMARWFGPRAFAVPICEIDLRIGGAYRIVMRSAEGVDYPMKGVYRDIVPLKLLVFTADLGEHPADWLALLDDTLGGRGGARAPREFRMTVIFEEHGAKTRLIVRNRFASNAVRDAMAKMGMEEGWRQTLDRLAECLADMNA